MSPKYAFSLFILWCYFYTERSFVNALEYCPTCLPYFSQNKGDEHEAPNIDTNLVIPVNATPLVLTGDPLSAQSLCNRGYGVFAFPSPNHTSTLSGGILCDGVFEFVHLIFFWNRNITQRSTETFDGVGYAITASLLFYNTKYTSVEEAIGCDDGLVALNVQCSPQGHIPNPKATNYQNVMQQIRTANTCVTIQPESDYNNWWFPDVSPGKFITYYAFSSKWTVNQHLQNVPITVLTLLYDTLSIISIGQFNTMFGSMLNDQGCPYDNVLPKLAAVPGEVACYQGEGLEVRNRTS